LLSIVGLGALFGFSKVEVPEAAATQSETAPEVNAQDVEEPTIDDESSSTAARMPASQRQ
jgi:hypothetical protein